MLSLLALKHVALHATLEVEFQPGFTVLTGETGAGKSLLLEALTLAVGARGDAAWVAPEAAQAEIVAAWRADAPDVQALLAAQEIPFESGEPVLCRRVIKREGGSRAWLNGTPVSLGTLQEVGAAVLEFHGQHGQQALLHPAQQRSMVDELGAHAALVIQVSEAFVAWQNTVQKFSDAEATLARVQAEAELRTTWRRELEALAYQPGEEAILAHKRQRAQQAAQLAQGVLLAQQALQSDTGGAVESLAQAARALRPFSGLSPKFAELAERLTNAEVEVRDCADELARGQEADILSDAELEALDDRLHALKQVARKHGIGIPDLTEKLAQLQTEATLADEGETALTRLQQQVQAAKAAYQILAERLHTAREAAAHTLRTAVLAQLAGLHMPHARFEINISHLPEAQWAAHGLSKMDFLLAANPGHPLQPLGKVASGGELSRLMLALKVACYAGLSPRTLVLDEVDTGLAGPTAHAVGLALKQLAQRHQVLVISHHPQVAALADKHLHVVKAVHGGTTRTEVKDLSGNARVAVLAEMLAGAQATEAATKAAQALLAA